MRIGGAQTECMQKSHAVWKRVMGWRVEEYERAMQVLHVPVAALLIKSLIGVASCLPVF